MPFTIKSIKELNKEARKSSSAIVNLEVYYDYAKNEKTKEETYEFDISKDTIESIDICENLFGQVPYVKLCLFDNGTYFHKINFAVGKKIFVRMWPRGDNDDEIPQPYLSGVYVIQSYRYITETNAEDYRYEILAIPDIVGYLDNIIKYYPDTSVNIIAPAATSKEAIIAVGGKCGITVVADSSFTTNDNMTWINTDKSGKKFISHIVSHSWISNDDSALFYLDKDGTGYYTSLKTICSVESKVIYANVATYDAQKDENGKHSVFKKTYKDILLDNYGYLNSMGGNTNKAYVYDPYNHNLSIAIQDLTQKTNASRYLLNKDVPKSVLNYSRYIANGETASFFPGISNRQNPGHVNTITNNIYFNNTHSNYDYAPMHNRTFQKSFFQNFLHLTVNTGTQVERDKDSKFREHIGDKITVEFETKSNSYSIQNGEYIICSIHHTWTRESSYTLLLTCVRDTITKTNTMFG